MSFGFNIGSWQHSWMGRTFPGLPGAYKNEKDQEIIGVKDAQLFWITDHGTGNSSVAGGGMTVTTFDYASYSDGAIVKINNNHGADVKVKVVCIHAKPIVRYSGEKGIVHDDFVDYDSILRDGEKKLEFGNNYIITKAQLEQLCDHYWKANNYKRHVYEVEIPGRCYWYSPGEWYTLTIGDAGQAEYISSVCECYDVQVECEAGGLGRTVVAFREIYQNWTKDSGALARFLGSGSPKDKYNFSRVLVASQYYPGPSDFRCDGTADQTEIQAAIDQVAGFGGGVVELTEGQFNITAAIDLSYDNIVLTGAGAKTIIEKNCDYAIEVAGAPGATIDNIYIGNLQIQRNSADTNATALIYANYAENLAIHNIYLVDFYKYGILITNSGAAIVGCNIYNTVSIHVPVLYGIYANGCARLEIFDNHVHDISIYETGDDQYSVYGIFIVGTYYNSVKRNIIDTISGEYVSVGIAALSGLADITDNIVRNIYAFGAETGEPLAYGIYINANGCNVLQNTIQNANTAGIRILGTGNRAINNYCTNCGNLIESAGCETAAGPKIINDGASNTNATWARDAGQVYAGTYSFKHTITATGSVSKARFCDNETTTDMHGLYAGTTYELSGYVYVPSAGGPLASEVTIHLEYYNAAAWSSAGVAATGQDAWELVTSGEIAIPSTATGVRAYVQIAAAASNGEYCYWDNLRLKPVGTHNLHSQNFYDGGTDTYVGV